MRCPESNHLGLFNRVLSCLGVSQFGRSFAGPTETTGVSDEEDVGKASPKPEAETPQPHPAQAFRKKGVKSLPIQRWVHTNSVPVSIRHRNL